MDEPLEGEPVSSARVRALCQSIIKLGSVSFGPHARKRMGERGISETTVKNVLRAGFADEGELEHGTYRYPVKTPEYCVIVAFRSEHSLVVVSVWRNEP